MEKMEHHRYTAVPVINRNGEYVDIVTEGDILWALKDHCSFDLRAAEQTPLSEVSRHSFKTPIGINSNMEDLMSLAINQNFVPIIDDTNVFIGIVTRKDILQYCSRLISETDEELEK